MTVLALDRYAPAYQFRERHTLRVRATPARIHAAIWSIRPDQIFGFTTLIRIRQVGRPLPADVRAAPRGTPILRLATATTFKTLVDTDREIVVATVVGRPKGAPRPATADDLLGLRDVPGYAIATMNYTIDPRADGTCLVATETRVYATDPGSRARFGWYWLAIRAGSGFIRRMSLRAIKRRAEAAT